MKSSTRRYCHRQSGRTAYRMYAGPAPTGPDLRLTALVCRLIVATLAILKFDQKKI